MFWPSDNPGPSGIKEHGNRSSLLRLHRLSTEKAMLNNNNYDLT